MRRSTRGESLTQYMQKLSSNIKINILSALKRSFRRIVNQNAFERTFDIRWQLRERGGRQVFFLLSELFWNIFLYLRIISVPRIAISSVAASLFDIPSGFRNSAQIISVTRFVFPHPCRKPSSVDVFSGDLKKPVGIERNARETHGITRELH